MTRRTSHEAVLRALDAALGSSLEQVKLNVVVVRGLNDSEVPDFVAMTERKNLSVRFIEFMPFTGECLDGSHASFHPHTADRQQMGTRQDGAVGRPIDHDLRALFQYRTRL